MLNAAASGTGDALATPTTSGPSPGDITSYTASEMAELRPARMLVPHERRSSSFLPDYETLIASDLGISRLTTDAELAELSSTTNSAVRAYLEAKAPAAEGLAYLARLRDALAQPRDIAEATEWGLEIPVNDRENQEEYDPYPNNRLGWFWVYDPARQESRAQRRERYMRDMRLVDTKGLARVLCRRYTTLKGLKADTDRARDIINDNALRRSLACEFVRRNSKLTIEDAEQMLLMEAQDVEIKGTPLRVDRAGQSDLFTVSSGLEAGRLTGRLDDWYQYHPIKATGRPRGSKTRRRSTRSS